MLTPYDDFPIHPSADPIGHMASGDPNHYDRSFFNGHQRAGEFFFGAAMGHYPNRSVIDGAFCLAIDGVQHSFFASGRMPLDRSTTIGPLSIEVLEPMRSLRYFVAPNEHGIGVDLTFRARTVAVEEPLQRKVDPDGILFTEHTRMTQWGAWSGTVTVDGDAIRVDRLAVSGTKDRSWGVRPVGAHTPTNRPFNLPQAFWLWAPLHFDDRFTHFALHERSDGSRWLETACVVYPMPAGVDPWQEAGLRKCQDLGYRIDWQPGRREMSTASLTFLDPVEGETIIDLERCFTFHMRGIGYQHPQWAHGTTHGDLATGRESITVADLDPTEVANLHVQTVVKARMGDRTGIGVLEQAVLGEHEPTGLTGLTDGYRGGGSLPSADR